MLELSTKRQKKKHPRVVMIDHNILVLADLSLNSITCCKFP